MDEKKEKRDAQAIFKRLRDAQQAKIRYGRATLTIERSDSVYLTPLAPVLEGHRKGELTEDDVAWAFVKERVTAHSPSFKWEGVQLAKLLPRVTAVTTEPKIKAKTPSELAPELEAIEIREREQWKLARKRIKQSIPNISRDFLSSLNRTNEMARAMRPAYADALETIRPNFAQIMKVTGSEISQQALASIRLRLPEIQETIRPTINLPPFEIDPKAFDAFVSLGKADLRGHTHINRQILSHNEYWRTLFQQVADAARGADSPDIAEAVEASAEEASKKTDDLDIRALTNTLDRLVKEQGRLAEQQQQTNQTLDEMQSDNSITRQIIIGLAVVLIWTLIQVVLAVKFGIYLPPPPEAGK